MRLPLQGTLGIAFAASNSAMACWPRPEGTRAHFRAETRGTRHSKVLEGTGVKITPIGPVPLAQ
jgi:hypothetical protein